MSTFPDIIASSISFISAGLTLVLAVACSADDSAKTPVAKKTHACAGAGRWFPGEVSALRDAVDGYLRSASAPIAGAPVAVIVPHAGYQYSGATAGKAYALLAGASYKRVILLGPTHYERVYGASVLRADAYETPLGSIPVDPIARDALLACSAVKEVPEAHRLEHSVENQLPMLQRAIGSFSMVEVLIGQLASEQRAALAKTIRGLLDEHTLLVASSDFTHYGPGYGYVPFKDRIPENLKSLNQLAVQEIVQIDVGGWDSYLDKTDDSVCGQAGIGLLLKVLEDDPHVRASLVAYDTSGNLTGDYKNSVTYASVAFWKQGAALTTDERKTLLRIAREAVVEYLRSGRAPSVDPALYALSPSVQAPGAAFVTLRNRGDLRGCIGEISPSGPLYLSVVQNACNACRDPRFVRDPVTATEAKDLTIEISVMGPVRRLDDTGKVQVGRDGLIIERGSSRGLLLPQVPTEQGWDREQFLAGTCMKAGLPTDAWKNPGTIIHRFSAEVFGEESAGGDR